MTTATLTAIRPIPVTIPPLDAEPLHDGDTPLLSTDADTFDPYLVITAREWCPECDGEGQFEYIQTSGGRAGQISPDSWTVACERCAGDGFETRSRCVVCGHLHYLDDWGIMADEPSCECDPEDVLAAIAEVAAIESYLSFYARSIDLADAAGLSISAGVHRVPWRYFRALVARHGLTQIRFPPATGQPEGFYTARYHVGGQSFPIFSRPTPWR